MVQANRIAVRAASMPAGGGTAGVDDVAASIPTTETGRRARGVRSERVADAFHEAVARHA